MLCATRPVAASRAALRLVRSSAIASALLLVGCPGARNPCVSGAFCDGNSLNLCVENGILPAERDCGATDSPVCAEANGTAACVSAGKVACSAELTKCSDDKTGVRGCDLDVGLETTTKACRSDEQCAEKDGVVACVLKGGVECTPAPGSVCSADGRYSLACHGTLHLQVVLKACTDNGLTNECVAYGTTDTACVDPSMTAAESWEHTCSADGRLVMEGTEAGYLAQSRACRSEETCVKWSATTADCVLSSLEKCNINPVKQCSDDGRYHYMCQGGYVAIGTDCAAMGRTCKDNGCR